MRILGATVPIANTYAANSGAAESWTQYSSHRGIMLAPWSLWKGKISCITLSTALFRNPQPPPQTPPLPNNLDSPARLSRKLDWGLFLVQTSSPTPDLVLPYC